MPNISGGSITIPAGVTSVILECTGGGARGGYGNSVTPGGGGGGGGYSKTTLAVSAGQVITASSQPYSDTTFTRSGTVVCRAKAGSPGTNASGSADGGLGGAGGQASAGIGDIKYNGGTGGLGSGNQQYPGGGGGGPATATGNGPNGSPPSTNTAAGNGGAGGRAGFPNDGRGATGATYSTPSSAGQANNGAGGGGGSGTTDDYQYVDPDSGATQVGSSDRRFSLGSSGFGAYTYVYGGKPSAYAFIL